MARFIVVLVLVAAAIIGAAFYFGWFQLSADHTTTNPSYTVTVDKDKIKEDQAQAEKKLQDMGHKVQEKIAPATQP